LVATCSSDCTVKIWDIDKLECLYTILGHNDVVRCIAYLPNKKFIASAGADL